MKKIILIGSLLTMGVYLNAQKKIKFSTQNYVGIVAGENNTELQLQTINGISLHSWFTGAGVGIDWYYLRSVPVFLSMEKGFQIRPKKNIYFSSAAGINFPWEQGQGYYGWWGGKTKTYPGFYWNAGLGYKITVGKQNDAILLHLGFSNKFYSEKVSMPPFECFIGPCPVLTETFHYNLRALSLKLGYGF